MSKTIRKNTVSSLILIMLLSIMPMKTTMAQDLTSSQKTEQELTEIIENYGEENLIFANGIVIDKDESILFEDLGIEESSIVVSNNNEIVDINNEVITGIQEGTTFILVQLGDKYKVVQVYVDNSIESISELEIEDRLRKQYVVFVDAGHGGTDPGAISNGIREKDINLTVALKVRSKLQEKGVQVHMNRSTDVFVDFKDTAVIANNANPDVFVSIHHNAAVYSNGSVNPNVYGLESYYTYNKKATTSYPKDKFVEYANTVHSSLIKSTAAYNRGVMDDTYYVTNHTKMPAILVEGGFLTNKNEAEKLKTNAYQEKIADGIVNGVMMYLEKNVELEREPEPEPEIVKEVPGERISGEDRYTTAIDIFDTGWDSSETAILVTGTNYPDALCATPLAAKYDAPILLTKNASLQYQMELVNIIKEKEVKNIIIIGSEGVVPKIIETELSEIGLATKRIYGSNRYETSVEIAKELNSNSNEIVVAYGNNFPDGLSIASIAAKKQIPILLTWDVEIPNVVKEYINSKNANKTYLLGSEQLINNNVANQLKNVERLAGKDRYETNMKIFNRFKNELNLSSTYIASALDFPDALAASALAAKNNAFVILTNPTYIMGHTRSIIESSREKLEKVLVIGSNGLMKDELFNSISINMNK